MISELHTVAGVLLYNSLTLLAYEHVSVLHYISMVGMATILQESELCHVHGNLLAFELFHTHIPWEFLRV